jgi:phytoene dehydrogenase-like protein
MKEAREIIVIGAGLGGLCTAALLAQAGHSVRLLEQAQRLGGRARSREQHGFVHNLGAHALYRGGPAQRVLSQLGIDTPGQRVGNAGAFVLRGDRLEALPAGFGSLFTTSVIGARSKLRLAGLMLTLGESTAAAARGKRIGDWLDECTADPALHSLLEMLVRLTCYAHAPQALDAELALRQLAGAVRRGVKYLDGGWQRLVDQAEARALAAGVVIERGVAVSQIEHTDRVNAVRTADGRQLSAAGVIAAVEPRALAALLPADAIAANYAATAQPLMAACLELGISGALPHPERVVVQSTEAPLYFANHSAYAALAPPGAACLHLVRYLAPGEDGRGAEPELHEFLERVQPGVLAQARVTRFMPNLTVHNDVPSAARAAGSHTEIAGLQLVGDWIDSGAMLLDGVLASAGQAVARIASTLAPSGLSSARHSRDALQVA